MSVLLFSISSTSVHPKPRTNSDSNDGHATSPCTASWLVSGHCPPCFHSPPAASLGIAWGVVRQPVRQPRSLHQFGERRQPCILTSLALTSLGGMRLSLADFRNRRESLMGVLMESDVALDCCCLLWCISGPRLYRQPCLFHCSGTICFLSGCYVNKVTIEEKRNKILSDGVN